MVDTFHESEEFEPATMQTIHDWYTIKKKLSEIKVKEMELRKRIAKTFFPSPMEGTNNFRLARGAVMKMNQPYTRSLNPAVYQALRADFNSAGIPKDIVVDKPSLVLKVYRRLDEQQAKIFDQALEIVPGSPTLEIYYPKQEVHCINDEE